MGNKASFRKGYKSGKTTGRKGKGAKQVRVPHCGAVCKGRKTWNMGKGGRKVGPQKKFKKVGYQSSGDKAGLKERPIGGQKRMDQ